MNEPKLRFKADDGSQFPDWEEKVFGDFVDTHLEKTSDKDKYPLYSLTIESGVQPKTDRYEREFLVKKEGDNYKIVPPNAFVYNPMNLRFGALKVKHEKFSVSVSGYYDVFSLKDNSVLAFWENYLVTPKMLNYYFSIATGSLIEKLRVHYSQFVKIKKPLPSLPEQRKISEFLSTVDTVIEKQKETVSAWEERKKGLMQKLFSQEVRFKADDGSVFPDWKKNKLGELGVFIKGAALSKADISEHGSPFILYGELYTTYNEVAYNVVRKTQAVVDQKYHSCIGDVIIPTSGESAEEISTATCVMIPNVILGGDLNIFRSEIVDGRIMSYILNYQAKRKIASIAQGKSVVHIQAKQLSNITVKYPVNKAEQQKIADCLSSLDEVIEKQKATLAAWKELKKGLLQQMFV